MKYMKNPHDSETCTTPNCEMCSGGRMAKGGEVDSRMKHQKGVHSRGYTDSGSFAGGAQRSGSAPSQEYAKRQHKGVLKELQDMPNPKLQGLADGGEVESDDPDTELHETVGKEMMEHIHSKNHKGLMDSLHAAIAMHKAKDLKEDGPDKGED